MLPSKLHCSVIAIAIIFLPVINTKLPATLQVGVGFPTRLASLAPLTANVRIAMPKLAQSELRTIIEQASLNVKRRVEVIEPSILASGAVQIPGSAGWFQAASSRTKVVAKNFSREALVTEEASKIIANM